MTVLVAYDGSRSAEVALARAVTCANALGEDVVVVTVVPEDESYAVGKGWCDETGSEAFDVEAVVETLQSAVADAAPGATFRYAGSGGETHSTIAERIQDVAGEILPSVIFVGTDNPGNVADPPTSVAGELARNAVHDVRVVQRLSSAPRQAIESEG